MDRRIVCVQIPSFDIAIARRADPSLRSCPVAIAPTPTGRARLLDASAEARADGVVSGMAADLAKRLCPALHILTPDPQRTRAVHEDLQQLVAQIAPVWEPVLPGSFYLDLTGTDRLYGRTVDAAARLERDITTRQQLAGIIGIAGNKLVSHLAATALGQPSHLVSIWPGSEPTFLEPLPITLLPGLRRDHRSKIRAMLDDLNLGTLGAIAHTSPVHLELAFGPAGKALYEWSLGIDPSPVQPAIEQPSITCACTIDPDAIDDHLVLGHALELLEELCRRLRRQHRVCRRLVLTIRHSDQTECSTSKTLTTPTYWEHDLAGAVSRLVFATFRRRVRLHRLMLRAEALEAPAAQLALFAPDPSPEPDAALRRQRLSVALDRIRTRFGDNAIRWGYATVHASPRPL